MTSTEDTQDLGNPSGLPSSQYRYVVRHIGSRPDRTPAGDRSLTGREYGTECVDSWTGNVMSVHWAGSAQLSSLVAETQCGERNGATTAITFPSKLALFIERSRDVERMPAGEVMEDVARILEWHLGRIRGLKLEPLDQTNLYVQAPEFNA